MTDAPFFYCLLTGPGRAAVAVVALRGSGVAAVVDRFLSCRGGPFAGSPLRRIRVGVWRSDPSDPAAAGEEVVATRLTDDRCEVHCHGGKAAAQAILRDLASAGGARMDWDRWLQAEDVSDEEAAARQALTRATTTRVAAILLDQCRGALAKELALATRGVSKGKKARSASKGTEPIANASASATLDAILARARWGVRLTRPFRVVLAGPPNVGKSSLINALAGYQRSIVFDEAGTTRDALTVNTAIDGWPVELVDTAGQRDSDDAIEQAAGEVARREMAAADLVLWLSEPESHADARFSNRPNDSGAALLVLNKIDLAPQMAGACESAIVVSAKTGAGLPDLLTAISHALVPDPPPPGAAVPITQVQLAQVQALRATIEDFFK